MLDARPAPDAPARPPLPTLANDPPAEPPRNSGADALFSAALALLPVLEAGRPLDAATLRDAMTEAFGASDADGGWVWKDAYEAAEAACVLFLQRYGRGMRRTCGAGTDGPRRMLAMLEAVAALEPSHTRRSEEQVRLQQFSTPLPLAYAALQAAAIRPGDLVLEPSAGTGMLAVMAECALGDRAAGALHLNEYAQTRARLLTRLFPQAMVTAFNAEAIADRLRDVQPTVVLMNPPFSATPGVDRSRHDADLRHVRSAASMLPPGGRLVTITSAHCVLGDAVGRLDPPARCVFTMAIDGSAYARRGTGFDTRLTVLERGAGPAVELDGTARAANAAELLDAVIAQVPKRQPIAPAPVPAGPARDLFGKPVAPKPATRRGPRPVSTPETRRSHDWGPISELTVETGRAEPAADADAPGNDAGPYAPWRPGAVQVPGAVEHPTPLVQSGTGAMALTTSLGLFLLLRFVGGAAGALVMVLASALLMDRLAAAGRDGWAAVIYAGVGSGIAISALAVPATASGVSDWQGPWLIAGALCLALSVLVGVLLWRTKTSASAASRLQGPGKGKDGVRRLIVAYGLVGFGYVITATFVADMVRADPVLQPAEHLVWLCVGLTAAPSVALWGWAGRRWGNERAFADWLPDRGGRRCAERPWRRHLVHSARGRAARRNLRGVDRDRSHPRPSSVGRRPAPQPGADDGGLGPGPDGGSGVRRRPARFARQLPGAVVAGRRRARRRRSAGLQPDVAPERRVSRPATARRYLLGAAMRWPKPTISTSPSIMWAVRSIWRLSQGVSQWASKSASST